MKSNKYKTTINYISVNKMSGSKGICLIWGS